MALEVRLLPSQPIVRALTDAQWERIRPHPTREKRQPRGGRPRADPRRCFEGILWVLWTGAPWSELPPRAYAAKLRRRGVSVTAADCLIAGVSIDHDVPLVHCHADFEAIKRVLPLKTLDWTAYARS